MTPGPSRILSNENILKWERGRSGAGRGQTSRGTTWGLRALPSGGPGKASVARSPHQIAAAHRSTQERTCRADARRGPNTRSSWSPSPSEAAAWVERQGPDSGTLRFHGPVPRWPPTEWHCQWTTRPEPPRTRPCSTCYNTPLRAPGHPEWTLHPGLREDTGSPPTAAPEGPGPPCARGGGGPLRATTAQGGMGRKPVPASH